MKRYDLIKDRTIEDVIEDLKDDIRILNGSSHFTQNEIFTLQTCKSWLEVLIDEHSKEFKSKTAR